jgi:hypothetical protein
VGVHGQDLAHFQDEHFRFPLGALQGGLELVAAPKRNARRRCKPSRPWATARRVCADGTLVVGALSRW